MGNAIAIEGWLHVLPWVDSEEHSQEWLCYFARGGGYGGAAASLRGRYGDRRSSGGGRLREGAASALPENGGKPEPDIDIRILLSWCCCQVEYIHIRLTFERGGRI